MPLAASNMATERSATVFLEGCIGQTPTRRYGLTAKKFKWHWTSVVRTTRERWLLETMLASDAHGPAPAHCRSKAGAAAT